MINSALSILRGVISLTTSIAVILAPIEASAQSGNRPDQSATPKAFSRVASTFGEPPSGTSIDALLPDLFLGLPKSEISIVNSDSYVPI